MKLYQPLLERLASSDSRLSAAFLALSPAASPKPLEGADPSPIVVGISSDVAGSGASSGSIFVTVIV